MCSPVQWDSRGFHLTRRLWGPEPLPRRPSACARCRMPRREGPLVVSLCSQVHLGSDKSHRALVGHWALPLAKGRHALKAGIALSDFSGLSSVFGAESTSADQTNTPNEHMVNGDSCVRDFFPPFFILKRQPGSHNGRGVGSARRPGSCQTGSSNQGFFNCVTTTDAS